MFFSAFHPGPDGPFGRFGPGHPDQRQSADPSRASSGQRTALQGGRDGRRGQGGAEADPAEQWTCRGYWDQETIGQHCQSECYSHAGGKLRIHHIVKFWFIECFYELQSNLDFTLLLVNSKCIVKSRYNVKLRDAI